MRRSLTAQEPRKGLPWYLRTRFHRQAVSEALSASPCKLAGGMIGPCAGRKACSFIPDCYQLQVDEDRTRWDHIERWSWLATVLGVAALILLGR